MQDAPAAGASGQESTPCLQRKLGQRCSCPKRPARAQGRRWAGAPEADPTTAGGARLKPPQAGCRFQAARWQPPSGGPDGVEYGDWIGDAPLWRWNYEEIWAMGDDPLWRWNYEEILAIEECRVGTMKRHGWPHRPHPIQCAQQLLLRSCNNDRLAVGPPSRHSKRLK